MPCLWCVFCSQFRGAWKNCQKSMYHRPVTWRWLLILGEQKPPLVAGTFCGGTKACEVTYRFIHHFFQLQKLFDEFVSCHWWNFIPWFSARLQTTTFQVSATKLPGSPSSSSDVWSSKCFPDMCDPLANDQWSLDYLIECTSKTSPDQPIAESPGKQLPHPQAPPHGQ